MRIPKTFDNALVRVLMWNFVISLIAFLIFDMKNPKMIPALMMCSLIIYSYVNLFNCKCK